MNSPWSDLARALERAGVVLTPHGRDLLKRKPRQRSKADGAQNGRGARLAAALNRRSTTAMNEISLQQRAVASGGALTPGDVAATDTEREPAPTAQPLPPAPDPLRTQVRRVHEARAGAATIKNALEEARRLFEQEHAELLAMARNASDTVAAEEAALRQLTLERYEATGDKTPAPGVGIRMVKTVDYDAAQAFGWAKQTGLALALDAAAFKKIAVASPDAVPCARVQETPQPTIAADLGKALAAEAV